MLVSEVCEARSEFRAMGTDCAVVVYGTDPHVEALADLGRRRVRILESVWSRFRADSELTRLNERAGHGTVAVSGDTEALLRAMHSGWQATGGAFDPTVLAAVRASGYDRDFSEVVASDFVAGVSAQAPGMAEVLIGDGSVCLPRGVGVDPGAIGKGLAADIVVDEIFEAGALGVLVDLGGDIAFAGSPGVEATWRIEICDERAGSRPGVRESLGCFEVPAGVEHAGIATSTSLTRRWAQGRHHVIDPCTGASTDEALVQLTVAGERAWECEVWATAILVRPPLIGKLPEGMSCVALESDRTRRHDFRTNPLREQVA